MQLLQLILAFAITMQLKSFLTEETLDTAIACIVFLSCTAHSSQPRFFQMPINRCEKCYFLLRDRCLHNTDTILAIQSAA